MEEIAALTEGHIEAPAAPEAEVIEAVVEEEPEELVASLVSEPEPESAVVHAPTAPHPLETALERTAGELSGTPTLLIEELTDYWYLEMASTYLDELERPSLPKGLSLMPIGSAAAVPLIVGALGDEAAVLSLRALENG